jgi:hypothetical protein
VVHDPTAHLGKHHRSQRNTIHADRRQSALFTGRPRPDFRTVSAVSLLGRSCTQNGSRGRVASPMRVCSSCGGLDTGHGHSSGGCGDSSTERKFPSDKVYRRDDRGIVGVESFGLQGFAFFIVHTVLDLRRGLTVPPGPAGPVHHPAPTENGSVRWGFCENSPTPC